MKAQQRQKIYHEIQAAQFLTVLSVVHQSICTQATSDFPQKLQ